MVPIIVSPHIVAPSMFERRNVHAATNTLARTRTQAAFEIFSNQVT